MVDVLANITLPYKEDFFQWLIDLLIRKPILDKSDDDQKMVTYLSENAKIGFLDRRIFSKSEFASTFKASDLESWGKYDLFNPEIKINENFAEVKMKFKESLLNTGVFRFKMNRQNNSWMITEYNVDRS